MRKEKKQQKKGKKDDKGPTDKGTDKEKKAAPSTAQQPLTPGPAQKGRQHWQHLKCKNWQHSCIIKIEKNNTHVMYSPRWREREREVY